MGKSPKFDAGVVALLAAAIDRAGSKVAFCRETGISRQHVYDLLTGKRKPGPKIAKALGLERVPTYRPLKVSASGDDMSA